MEFATAAPDTPLIYISADNCHLVDSGIGDHWNQCVLSEHGICGLADS